jgi:hypothetical protein
MVQKAASGEAPSVELSGGAVNPMWHAKMRQQVLADMETVGPARVADALRHHADKRWAPFYVRELAALLEFAIDIEAPFNHLQPVPMSSEFRTALRNLLLACATFGVPTTMKSVGSLHPSPHDDKQTIRFTFHSHGEGPNRWHIKDSHAPERFHFNRTGYSGWLKLSDEQVSYIERAEGAPVGFDANLLLKARRSKYEQPDSAAGIPAGAIFFPLQVRDDTVIAHHRLDQLDVLRAACEHARAARPLVVKRHPTCQSAEIESALSAVAGAPFVHVIDAPIDQALSAADVILTGNSSVGFSAICGYKPVISFGASDYEICTRAVESAPQLMAALEQGAWAVDRARYDRFLGVFFNELTFPIEDEAAWRRKIAEALAHAVLGFTHDELRELARNAQ